MGILRMCILFSAVLGACGTAMAQSSSTSGTQPVISLKISAAQSPIKTGAPVRVRVILTNEATHDVVFWRDTRGMDCRVDVRDASGKLAPDTKLGYIVNGHVANPDVTRISPGGSQWELCRGNSKGRASTDVGNWMLPSFTT